MCGIAGLIARDPLRPEHYERVSLMSKAMVHRGPDGEGHYYDKHVALAMRRLSIIDVARGWQPLHNEDGTLTVIANGEIYNYVELRARLQARGHRFATGSDCEVIVHLYEEYGRDCVHHLRGMFSFALWDGRVRRLILVRDRMGEKPLYLFLDRQMLVFGSELKTLLNSKLLPFELDPHAVDLFFHFNYVPEPRTALRHLRKLPAAHMLTVALDPWKVEETAYWSMDEIAARSGDPVEAIRAELETVGELVVRSDVPVGVALSGGLDSSAIAAVAAKKYPGQMHAFSIGYSGKPLHDERADAKALADHLGLPFHGVEITQDWMVRFFPELVYWCDDPIADLSGFGYYAVMNAARQAGVAVMLQGQGGDELFWGYPWTAQAAKESFRKGAVPAMGQRRFQDYLSVQWLPQTWSKRGLWNWGTSAGGLRTSWESFLRDRDSRRDQAVFYDLTPDFRIARRQMRNWYAPAFVESLGTATPYDPFTIAQPWPRPDILLTRLICSTYLLENGMAQGDRLGMASSVELRLPLVDYRLVETVIGLRKAQTDYELPPKAWFRTALKGILPDWVLRRRKRGFHPPVIEWHRALFAKYGPLLHDGYLVQAGVLKPEAARTLSDGPFALGAVVPPSYKALVLEMWCRRFSDGG
ncbi:MAG TPA: asparagine synthase (glutamine-hydrolyzing) [Nitrospiria bacterium]|nr:asparagine synthase (glutamine-hydrolyzing) [Nitrospiria bacterium]